MFYKKIYQIGNLLDKNWQERVSIIENLSKKFETIPSISFEIKRDKLIYRQKFIKKDESIGDFEELANMLESFEKINFIHGDINRKNIISSSGKFFLIDLEPSLKQMKKGCEALMFTMPYISQNDFQNRELSIESDKIGFYFFILRKLGKFSSKNIVELKNRVLNSESVIDESILKMSYGEILKLEGIEQNMGSNLPTVTGCTCSVVS